ncbi:hypothetical protein J2S30_001556 [Herbaspirillum rubrisubalbicans]|nr:hypothetical protein [Herbaspirillum rubrisubalbicans]
MAAPAEDDEEYRWYADDERCGKVAVLQRQMDRPP